MWGAGHGVISLTLQPAGLSQEDTLTRQALVVTALGTAPSSTHVLLSPAVTAPSAKSV